MVLSFPVVSPLTDQYLAARSFSLPKFANKSNWALARAMGKGDLEMAFLEKETFHVQYVGACLFIEI